MRAPPPQAAIMMGSAVPQGAFERWAALQTASSDVTNRQAEKVDLAFWERVADDYDRGALARRVPAVLQRVLELVPPGSAVLDVGAGTGAFALEVARRASWVTAIDYSPAMLRVLRRKLEADDAPTNIQTVLARWEDAEVEPHDVVLVANALYRLADLRAGLVKIVCAARRRGIVLWSVGRQDAPQYAVREQVQPGHYRPGPDYVHLLDGLFALDVFAQVELIETNDTQRYPNDRTAVEALLSWQPISDDQHARGAALLPRVLDADGTGWLWRRRGRVALIWWEASAQ